MLILAKVKSMKYVGKYQRELNLQVPISCNMRHGCQDGMWLVRKCLAHHLPISTHKMKSLALRLSSCPDHQSANKCVL